MNETPRFFAYAMGGQLDSVCFLVQFFGHVRRPFRWLSGSVSGEKGALVSWEECGVSARIIM